MASDLGWIFWLEANQGTIYLLQLNGKYPIESSTADEVRRPSEEIIYKIILVS